MMTPHAATAGRGGAQTTLPLLTMTVRGQDPKLLKLGFVSPSTIGTVVSPFDVTRMALALRAIRTSPTKAPGGPVVTRVPMRNHQVPEFPDRPDSYDGDECQENDSVGKPKNLYHFLVVGKGGNEQHYEQDQIRQGNPSHNH